MTPKLLVAAFLLNVGSLSAVELRGVVVESTEGIFLINNLKVEGSGTDQSFRVKWNGSITNNTGKEWHKVTFCGKGFEAEDKPLLAAGEPCLLRLWMYAWKPGAQMRWKGSAKMRLADGKRRVALARMEWSVSEILTDPESVLIFPQTCSRVWSAGMKVFVDSKFRPTVSDKDSFIASFEYTGGNTVARAFGNTNQPVKAYTATKIGWLATWDAFRIESAGLMLRPGPNEGCRAQIDMSFAGFDKRKRWYKLGSNHQYEKGLLAKINNLVSEDYEQDLDEAIRQLPTSDPPTSERTEAAERIPATGISSDPAGAEIEIDEEFVGSTPSRINLEPGRHTIVIRKRGFSEWKRVVRVRSGDALTVHAELEPKAP